MRKVMIVINGKSVTIECDDTGRISLITLERVLVHLLGSENVSFWTSGAFAPVPAKQNGTKG